MNYKSALEKLWRLRELMKKVLANNSTIPIPRDNMDEICILYGEVAEIIERLEGRNDITVPSDSHGLPRPIFPNYIEAGYLSGNSYYKETGYQQLLKVIGKVRRLDEDPFLPQDEVSVGSLIRALNRFRECCQYLEKAPLNERDVQDIVWIMLRSQFDRIDREHFLPKFGIKSYKPDFGLPQLGTLVEVKYIGKKTDVSIIQEEILADVPGYLNEGTKYSSLVILVYDAAQKVRDARKFIESLRSVDGIIDVIVVPGIGTALREEMS